ncbi:MAG: flagellar M-ring protein FliF C-terminal domain-containing protein [Lachnospiraceae bacterium]|nr:flagellar M-ring protein FliF C-terminal domain-containing protein [Lachnospiraceae bacterium]
MGDRIKQIPQQILEFWKKFTSKQRTIIIALALAIIVTVVIFVVMFTRTTYEQIAVYEKTSDTAAAKEILEEQGILYRVSDDGLTLSVDSKKVADARMALGANSVGADSNNAYTYEQALDNDLSTTSKEKDEKIKLARQNEFANVIVKTIEGVEAASVQITYADDSTAILEEEKDNTCAAMLTINDKFKSSAAKGIANYLATSIGNSNTNNIKIIDQNGNILFSGADNEDGTASLASAEEYKNSVVNDIKTQVQALLLKSSNYNDVEVAPNIDVNFDKSTSTDEHFYTDDGQETGPKSYDYNYHNENNSDSGNIPGTDANDGETTDYDLLGDGSSSGTTDITKNQYNTSKRTTVTQAGVAKINYDNSSISIVLNRYRSYYEDELKDQLKENDQTFAEFKEANGNSSSLEVDPALITSVSMATGIAEENISIIAYEVPLFYDATHMSVSTMAKNYLQYILALLIVALLLFVVFKGMKPVEIEEMEPELSVEALLATTKENQSLDDIEFSDKSAAREQIEKFVDENPEAVAQLLRNWLNEDWE